MQDRDINQRNIAKTLEDNGHSMRFIVGLDRLPRYVLLPASFLLMAIIGGMDFLTGYEMAFSVFYLLPISLLAWAGGRWLGLGGALLGAAIWGVVDHESGHVYSHPLYFYWNTGMRALLFVGMSLVISTLKKSLEQERALARIDHLTGAFNTRSFIQILQAEVDRSHRYERPFTVAYMDLDKFKSVNDTLGHSAGDALLRAVVDLTRRHMRSTDSIARLGGDEFALLFPETDQAAARSAISKMQSTFVGEMEKRGWPVTVSIGCLTLGKTELTVEEIIRKADNLMYAAKMGGRSSARFSPGESQEDA
jgi:diguanylate cyclase (GGDEF)-like protein